MHVLPPPSHRHEPPIQRKKFGGGGGKGKDWGLNCLVFLLKLVSDQIFKVYVLGLHLALDIIADNRV